MENWFDINSEKAKNALSQIIKGYPNIVGGHPNIWANIYILKDGSTLIDQPGHGMVLFPQEHDTIKWYKRLTNNIDGTEV